MIYTVSEIATKILPIVTKYDISRIYLFGSYAKGQADEESDIDLVMESVPSLDENLLLFDMLDELEEIFGKDIDLITLEQLDKGASPIAQEVRKNFNKERILLYERKNSRAG